MSCEGKYPEKRNINGINTKSNWLEYHNIYNVLIIRIGYFIKLNDFIYRPSMNVLMKHSQLPSFDHGISTSKELWVWFVSINYRWVLPLMLSWSA